MCSCCGAETCRCLDEDWCAQCFHCEDHCACGCQRSPDESASLRHTSAREAMIQTVGRYSKRDGRSRAGLTLPETRLTIRIPQYLRVRLLRLMKRLDMSQSEVVRLAIEQVSNGDGGMAWNPRSQK